MMERERERKTRRPSLATKVPLASFLESVKRNSELKEKIEILRPSSLFSSRTMQNYTFTKLPEYTKVRIAKYASRSLCIVKIYYRSVY